ncbi:MAG: nucleotidyltransferase domain-containing protein [Candidatus Eisenbacteria bacterium]|jgi:predicted nucleotidyltransferase
MDRTKQLQEAVALLKAAAQPTRIILFGSCARGCASEDSDVDLLVVEAHVADRAAEMVRLARVLSPLRLPVDILVVSEEAYGLWSAVPDTVYHEARENGRILYEAA